MCRNRGSWVHIGFAGRHFEWTPRIEMKDLSVNRSHYCMIREHPIDFPPTITCTGLDSANCAVTFKRHMSVTQVDQCPVFAAARTSGSIEIYLHDKVEALLPGLLRAVTGLCIATGRATANTSCAFIYTPAANMFSTARPTSAMSGPEPPVGATAPRPPLPSSV